MKKYISLIVCILAFYNLKLESKEYFILSIDGGGTRGVIPAALLKNLEEDINGRCAEVFDCISGTSTGSLIAAGLTIPDPRRPHYPKYKAKDLLEMYIEDIPNIFSNSFFYSLKTLWGWWGPKYQKDILENYVKEKLFDFKMKDSLTDLIITSFDLIREKGFYFENFKNVTSPLNNHYSMTEAVLASTAAPSYFSPEILKNSREKYALVDGGLFADDPSALTLRECIKYQNLKDTQIYILALGCGKTNPEKINIKKIEEWGLIEYLPEIVESLFDSLQITTNEELECLKKLINLKYIKIDINIPPEEAIIDITDKKVLNDLIEKANKSYKEDFKKSEDGQKLIYLLKERLKNKTTEN